MRILFVSRSLFQFVTAGIVSLLSPPAFADQQLSRFEYTQIRMGVPARIVVYAPDAVIAERACTAAFRRFAELEDIMSDYRPTSELMRLCAQAGGPPVKVSRELFTVLRRAQEVALRSDGAFDVTVGPLVALWRKARREMIFPTPEERANALQRVGWQKIRLNARHRTVQLETPGMQLDLGGIAKGYAGDEAQKTLKKHGIRSALVEAGGDIVLSDPPPGKSGWEIEIVNPDPNLKKNKVALSRCAISSSGDTEQYVEFNGIRYSHIVDPRTGLGLTSRIAVTVIAPNGLTSDSLATAISVLGAARGTQLARSYRRVTVSIRNITISP